MKFLLVTLCALALAAWLALKMAGLPTPKPAQGGTEPPLGYAGERVQEAEKQLLERPRALEGMLQQQEARP